MEDGAGGTVAEDGAGLVVEVMGGESGTGVQVGPYEGILRVEGAVPVSLGSLDGAVVLWITRRAVEGVLFTCP